MSWKLWATGEVVEASEFQSYLQNQVVQTYAGTAARSSALGTATTEGMISYLNDTNKLQFFDGSAWRDVATATSGTAANAGTATYAVTAGTAVYGTNAGTAVYATTSGTAIYATNAGTAVGLSGTITSTQVTGTAVTLADTATVTNTMLAGSIANDKLVNSIITMNGTAVSLGGSVTITGGTITGMLNPMTTQGDLIVGSVLGTPGRLGIGTSGYVLTSDGTAATWAAGSAGSSLPSQTGNAGELLITNGTAASWSNTVTANATYLPALIAKGIAGQYGNIQEWQNSGGTVTTAISASGFIDTGYADIDVIRMNLVGSGSTTAVPLMITGASGQTANLQEWQNSGGTVLASVSSAGLLTAQPATPSNANSADNVGYVGMPQVSTATGLSLTATHAGKHIYTTATGQTHTIPANGSVPLEVGTTIVFVNPAAVTTTIAITTDTLLLAGTGTTGSRTLAPYGMATALKITSTSWIISGNGLT